MKELYTKYLHAAVDFTIECKFDYDARPYAIDAINKLLSIYRYYYTDEDSEVIYKLMLDIQYRSEDATTDFLKKVYWSYSDFSIAKILLEHLETIEDVKRIYSFVCQDKVFNYFRSRDFNNDVASAMRHFFRGKSESEKKELLGDDIYNFMYIIF